MNLKTKAAYKIELAAFTKAMALKDWPSAWLHIERAHILGQYFVIPHLETHWLMFGLAFKTKNYQEILAQIPRLLLAAPGSLTGKAPKGNPGSGRVGIFTPSPTPEDLLEILESK